MGEEKRVMGRAGHQGLGGSEVLDAESRQATLDGASLRPPVNGQKAFDHGVHLLRDF
jgi:hypothetical protein